MLVPVLLAGGLGTRLWPVSRKSFPKKFVNLVDPKKSLLQLTVERCNALLTENQGWISVSVMLLNDFISLESLLSPDRRWIKCNSALAFLFQHLLYAWQM